MEYKFSDKIASLKPSAVREILKSTSDPEVISLAAGNPAPEAFPVEDIRKIGKEILDNEPILALQYGVTEGYQPLIDELKAMVKRRLSIGKDFDSSRRSSATRATPSPSKTRPSLAPSTRSAPTA